MQHHAGDDAALHLRLRPHHHAAGGVVAHARHDGLGPAGQIHRVGEDHHQDDRHEDEEPHQAEQQAEGGRDQGQHAGLAASRRIGCGRDCIGGIIAPPPVLRRTDRPARQGSAPD
ncbi:hypothetical protein AZA_33284 [Nitrospirillum viridazoti Y2]|nr:hypothetical protein AZA_33284 [Nitrospirillum amazonense Y2]